MSTLPPSPEEAQLGGAGEPAPESPASGLEVVCLLGEGSMGRVELVRDLRDGGLYAMKRAPVGDEALGQLLRKEFHLLSCIAHPQVPAAHELLASASGDGPALLMEYVPGTDLIEGARAWGPAELPRLLALALSVTGFVHGRGVVHGDLKPSNLRVSPQVAGGRPRLVVLDFGLAHALAQGSEEEVGGSPAYLAPEIFAGAKPSERSDLFALGRSFLEALRELGDLPATDATTALESVARRLAAADADLAYSDAHAALDDLLEQAGDASLLTHLPRATEPRFVGRRHELDLLQTRLTVASAGRLRSGLILLRGPAGSGRSRLLTEFWREAVLTGAEVYRHTCVSGDPPLAAVRGAARTMLGSTDSRLVRVETALSRDVGAVPQVVLRDLARAFGSLPSPPRVLLLDDLESADSTTLAFLSLLARTAGGRGPLIVGAVREADSDALRPIDDFPGSGEPREEIRLEPLTANEVRELAASLRTRAGRGAPDWDSEIVRLAAGWPGPAAILASDDDPDVGAGKGRATVLRSLVERKTRRLSDTEIDLLRDLAVLGRVAPRRLLAEMRGEAAAAALESALLRLREEGLVECVIGAEGRGYRLVADALAPDLLAGEAAAASAERHRRAFDACSRLADPRSPAAPRLARHALGSGSVDLALDVGPGAVRHLLDAGQPRAAHELAEQLVFAIPDERPSRSEFLLTAAEAALRTGHTAAARRHLGVAAAAPHGAVSADEEGRRLLLLGATLEAEGDLESARATLDAGLSELPVETSAGTRIRGLQRVGSVEFRLGRRSAARKAWEQGLAESALDLAGTRRAALLNDLAVLSAVEGDLERSEEYHEEARGECRLHGDLEGEARALTNLAGLAFLRGQLANADRLFERALARKREVGSRPSQAITLTNLGTVAIHRGRYGDALRRIEDSLSLRVACRDRVGEAITRRILAWLLIEKDEFTRAAGELAQARAILESSGALASQGGEHCLAEAELAFCLGDFAGAERSFEAAGAAASPAGEGARRAFLGRLRLEQGRPREALAELRLALELLEKQQDPVERAWARLEVGRALLASEGPDVARPVLLAAGHAGHEIGVPRLAVEAAIACADAAGRQGDLDGAHGHLEAVAEEARSLGAAHTTFRYNARKGFHAAACGQRARAALWWLRCVRRLSQLAAELPDDGARRQFLARPEFQRVLRALARLIRGEQPAPPGRAEIPEGEAPREVVVGIDGLRELEEQASQLAAPVGDESAPLRPEALQRLLRIVQDMNRLQDREDLAEFLRDRMCELFDAQNSLVVLLEPEGTYRVLASGGDEREISHTLVARVLSEGRPVLLQDAREDPELRDKGSVRRLGLVSVLCAPLVVDGAPVGVLQFDHRNDPGPFTLEDLTLLELFAEHAATALQNLELVERLHRTLDDRRRDQTRLLRTERLKAVSDMTARVAHDFNNMLSLVVGLGDLVLGSEALPEELRPDVEMLRKVASQGSERVRRLQDFAGGSPTAEAPRALDLREIVETVLEACRPRFFDREGAAEWSVTTELGPVPIVVGQRGEVHDLVLNLVVNALDAMPGGGTLTVRLKEREGDAVLEIEDTGTGVDPEIMGRIFEPYFTTKSSGHGLGLSLCWGAVHRLRGRIECERAHDGGALFRVILPPGGSGQATLGEPEAGTTGAKAGHRKLRVLVVDDDPLVLRVICRMLEVNGHEASPADSGSEALELLDQQPFDVVLTDYSMPEMNGAVVAREVKRRRPDCSVILITGCLPEDEMTADLSRDVECVLRKPVTAAALDAAVQR